ncbi:unnamed protein product [Closterium sp. NIES-65]|nr:unnamed protein product [Closterium sp. NIES-65]
MSCSLPPSPPFLSPLPPLPPFSPHPSSLVLPVPVFPWVIQDYTSKELDLTNPATFRDLSKVPRPFSQIPSSYFIHTSKCLQYSYSSSSTLFQIPPRVLSPCLFTQVPHIPTHTSPRPPPSRVQPVGALDAGRLEKFVERYHSFADPIIPKSTTARTTPAPALRHSGGALSAASGALYVSRPGLQGGQFDHPDRLFLDVAATWRGVTSDMSDVKELVRHVKELVRHVKEAGESRGGSRRVLSTGDVHNINGLHLGSTQKGEVIGDVKLPPWASSAADFVRKQRAALESEYVSSNLHNWIDSSSGTSRRAREALAAHNVFFYVTYEGAVDIDSITNPVSLLSSLALSPLCPPPSSYVQAITSLTSRHLLAPTTLPPDREEGHAGSDFLLRPDAVTAADDSAPPRIALDYALHLHTVRIVATSDAIVTVDLNAPACHVAVHQWQPNTPDGHGWPFLFQAGRSSLTGSAILRMLTGAALGGKGSNSETSLYRASWPPCSGDKAHAGTRFSVKLVSVDSTRVLETAAVHGGPVTCVALSLMAPLSPPAPRTGWCCCGKSTTPPRPSLPPLPPGSRLASWLLGRGAGGRVARRSTAAPTGPHDPALAAAAAAVSASEGTSRQHGSGRSGLPERGGGGGMSEGPTAAERRRGHGRGGGAAGAEEVAAHGRPRAGAARPLGHHPVLRRVLGPRPRCLLLALPRCAPPFPHEGPLPAPPAGGGAGGPAGHLPEGVVVVWERRQRALRAFTINGERLGRVSISEEDGDVSSVQVSSNGLFVAVGTDCSRWRHVREKERQKERERAAALCRFKLPEGTDVTALALSADNTNLLCSTSAHLAPGQLILYSNPWYACSSCSNPLLSVKMVDHMLRLGWEGSDFASIF